MHIPSPRSARSVEHAESTVGRASARGELQLRYQPLVGLADAAPVAVEALVRWWHPRGGLLTPETFLADLARAGELPLLDDWVLRTAIADFAAHRRALSHDAAAIALHVNVSAERVLAPGLPELLVDAASKAGLPPSLVRIEVPEALVVDDLHGAARPIGQLRDAGVAVVVDDAGSGISLRRLRAVAADGVKIDRCYVAGFLGSGRDRAVVQRLVDLAGEAGLAVTVVGVETEEQRAALLGMGCPTAQGWLFAAADPLAECLTGSTNGMERERAAVV
ncbi:EAL domain-containing protein [Geodermatophilus sp. YIM 151500]|uniref:EAL domain-containing protein n=1 Tax=Geodermatophilus sp. YIM 151500 TaxID=2984531 RepID=UPI0021E50D33|nr:EAL domain-containing protein [Geodermatophilus sp. YIM 151500]MCV2488287.1 EAL domain-containing protein [Geodermatophilus sp. YIM 151500]